jgi:hypothetical protein
MSLLNKILLLIGILLIAIILALIPKPTEVSIEVEAEGVSFDIAKDLELVYPVSLINSPSAEEVRLKGTERIYLDIEQLLDSEGNLLIQNRRKITIEPENENSCITFKKGEGDLDLKSLEVMPYSKIKISAMENYIDIKVDYNREKYEDGNGGEISVGTPFTLLLKGYKICNNGWENLHTEENNFKVIPIPQTILFSSKDSMNVILSFPTKNFQPICYKKQILINSLNFTIINEEGKKETTIKKGKIEFKGINKDPIELGNLSFIHLPKSEQLILREITLYPDVIGLTLIGTIKQLKYGQMLNSLKNVIPSWLEWLGRDQLIGLIIGFVMGMISFLVFLFRKE